MHNWKNNTSNARISDIITTKDYKKNAAAIYFKQHMCQIVDTAMVR